MKKEQQHISSVTFQVWFDHFNKVLDCESLSVSDNKVENNALASTFGPVVSVDTLDGVISVSEVQAAIEALKDNKAAGPDGLSSEFFRYSASCVLHFLAEYFNKLFDTGLRFLPNGLNRLSFQYTKKVTLILPITIEECHC